MLTYSPSAPPRRNDHPWLLVIMAVLWISGATFFHAPWEPYEPYVVAVVKSMVSSNMWLVPYISTNYPYLDLQPFYFWLYALLIKIFNFSDIANAIRVINSLIILLVIYLMGKIGSGLPAFKNGRSVVMILISSIGFINNAYQLSPNIVVLLGFSLYIFALQQSEFLPGICAWLLSLGLILISLNFTCAFIVMTLLVLLLLPLFNHNWRTPNYFITISGGTALFALIFISYVWQLNRVNHGFFLEWKHKYTVVASLNLVAIPRHLWFYLHTLFWYTVPSWFLVTWTLYKRGRQVFQDKILQLCALFIFLICLNAIISGRCEEAAIFPIIIPMALLASVEIDSIRISIVSLLNWFSLFIFGLSGLCIIILYIALNSGHPLNLFKQAQAFAPTYIFNFNFWQLALAVFITMIWVFMITRKHIRGREMVSNWASGTTFVLVIFASLCLPWFNAVLSFKDVVASSLPFIHPNGCVATNGYNNLPSALWYYYADIRLFPSVDINNSNCDQALLAVEGPNNSVDSNYWHQVWSSKRPVDKMYYVLVERIKSN
jgi:hypothetical protein